MNGHDIPRLEKTLKSALRELKKAGDGGDLAELLKLLHQPGWTTPAEFVLTQGLAESLVKQVQLVNLTKAALVEGARQVELRG